MIDLGQRPALAGQAIELASLHTRTCLAVSNDGHELERDPAGQLEVLGVEDNSERSPSDDFLDLVAIENSWSRLAALAGPGDLMLEVLLEQEANLTGERG